MVTCFKGALKSKVNHLKRHEVTGQGKILANQGFDHTVTMAHAIVTPPYHCVCVCVCVCACVRVYVRELIHTIRVQY